MHKENIVSNTQYISVYTNLLFCLAIAYLQELLAILSTWSAHMHLFLFSMKGCKKRKEHEVIAEYNAYYFPCNYIIY